MTIMTDPHRASEIAGKRKGPHLHLKASCFGCAFERSESYRVQGDSGHDIYCDHPNSGGKRIGDTCWDTPDWCPFAAQMLAVREALTKGQDDG